MTLILGLRRRATWRHWMTDSGTLPHDTPLAWAVDHRWLTRLRRPRAGRGVSRSAEQADRRVPEPVGVAGVERVPGHGPQDLRVADGALADWLRFIAVAEVAAADRFEQ